MMVDESWLSAAPPVEEVGKEYLDLANELVRTTFGCGHRTPQGAADDFSRGEAAALGYLAHYEDKGVTPGALSQAMGVSSARTATILNNLERKGYVCRRHDTSDRRRVFVTITAEGRAFVAECYSRVVGQTARLLATLGEDDARDLIRIYGRIREVVGTGPVRDVPEDGTSSEGGR